MYCRECGNKLNKNNNYCDKCGAKNGKSTVKDDLDIDNNKINSDTSKILLLIMSVICIFGAFVFNVFVLPFTIFGIIMGIKKKDAACLFLNIISSLLALFIFFIMLFLMFRVIFYLGKKVDNNVEDYYHKFKDNFEENYSNEKKYNNSRNVDIVGTWYLYSDDKIDDSTYYKFNADNSFMYYVDNNVYVGTYSIDKDYYNHDEGEEEYKLDLDVITLIKEDKTIVDSNLDDFSYSISVNKNTIDVKNLSDNTTFVLKKDVKTVY